MLFIFSTPVLIRYLWQLKTVVFLHWCLIHAILLFTFLKHAVPLAAFSKTLVTLLLNSLFSIDKTGTQIQSCNSTSHLPSISTVIALAEPSDRNAFNVLSNIKEEPTDVETVESQDRVSLKSYLHERSCSRDLKIRIKVDSLSKLKLSCK